MKKPRISKLEEIRRAVADYIYSEGCSCRNWCRNKEDHDDAAQRLAQLLGIPPHKDGSGYQFHEFRS